MTRLISQAPGGQSPPQQNVGLAPVEGVGLAVNSEDSDESANESAELAALMLAWSARLIEGKNVRASNMVGERYNMLMAW